MLETLTTGFIGGIIAWFCTELVAKPLIRFADMRREVTQCLVVYGNVRTRFTTDQTGKLVGSVVELPREEEARLLEGQKAYRDLAGRMRGFANVDHVANWIMKGFGYDADKIASALIGYSTEFEITSVRRAHFHNEVQALLRIIGIEKPR